MATIIKRKLAAFVIITSIANQRLSFVLKVVIKVSAKMDVQCKANVFSYCCDAYFCCCCGTSSY